MTFKTSPKQAGVAGKL